MAPKARRRASSVDLLPLLVADVYECAGALRDVGDQLAGRAGHTQARWQLLSVLSEGDWTASTAARRLGVSRQAVQRLADVLEREGSIRSDDNPQHRRAPLLRLTDRGHEALRAITAAARDWHRVMASGLEAADLEVARRTLQAVAAACRTAPAAWPSGDDGRSGCPV